MHGDKSEKDEQHPGSLAHDRLRPRAGHWVSAGLAGAVLAALVGWVAHGSPSEAKSVAVTDQARPRDIEMEVLPALRGVGDYDEAAPAKGAADKTPIHPASRWAEFTVQRGDTLSAIFQRAGLSPADLRELIALGGHASDLISLRPGETIRIQRNASGRLEGLDYALGPLDTWQVRRSASALTARVRHVEPERSPVIASGTVNHSLSQAMERAGLPAEIAAQVAGVFRWKVDFRHDMRPGARFSVVYERLRHGGHEIGVGPLLAAELRIGHRVVRAFRFTDADGRADYYDADGHSLKPSLLRTPVAYTRISSPFSLRRYDPVVHVWRPHYGVDLAAPRGTPIKAAGDGVIRYIGRAAGYGNLVEIRNFGDYQTRYAHMWHFAKGLHKGSHVHQGQVIGYVGATGEATGPHLHYEIRVAGKPRNPLKVALPNASPVPSSEMTAFNSRSQRLTLALDEPRKAATELAQRRQAWPPHLVASGQPDGTPLETARAQ